jgi:endonuclease/exonuclease/phosphatase family metal-dependent hydrolase
MFPERMKYSKIFFITCYILVSVLFLTESYADSTVTICSLNLYRLGEKGLKKDSTKVTSQVGFLVKRILDAECDIVGLQELVGKQMKESKKVISFLTSSLKDAQKSLPEPRIFRSVLAQSNDAWNRNAFIFDENRFLLKYKKSWNRQALPKLDIRSAPWSHTRGPLLIVLEPKSADAKSLMLVNYHLKSKASGWKDPLGTKFEYGRMLAAAGIRELLEKEALSLNEAPLRVLLGDRNTNSSGAASEVLSGRLVISDFSKKSSCSISPEGTALCPPEGYRLPDMIPLLQKKQSESGVSMGTFKLGKREEILDEIYIPEEDLFRVRNEQGLLRVRTEGDYRKGSDHLLSAVTLNISR